MIYLDLSGVDLIPNPLHSSPNYFKLSFFLVWLNTCLRRYSFALDPIRGYEAILNPVQVDHWFVFCRILTRPGIKQFLRGLGFLFKHVRASLLIIERKLDRIIYGWIGY